MIRKLVTWCGSTSRRIFSISLVILISIATAQAGEKVILRFDKTHGSRPISGLTGDSEGNLYGTTSSGGAEDCGTVFELSPSAGSKWTATVLYSFHGCHQVALTAQGTLAIDKAGNLFGVWTGNGNTGLIFELTKRASGTWSYSVVHSFDGNEGSPNVNLTWDSAGNLYGTANEPWTVFDGEAFELSPQSDGTWKETKLYTFPAPNGLGYPTGGVIFDNKGNLYGSAFYGSNGHFGAVYELTPQSTGPWKLTVLYDFTAAVGDEPYSRLTFDTSGNLYGTTTQLNLGIVFQLSPSSSGQWRETTIHSFTSGRDGAFPVGVLVFDASGSLYGTTNSGGSGCNQFLCGTAYKLAPQSDGTWKETILQQFESAGDGSEPLEGLFLDSSGNLFGTTPYGGSRYGYGTVYEITP